VIMKFEMSLLLAAALALGQIFGAAALAGPAGSLAVPAESTLPLSKEERLQEEGQLLTSLRDMHEVLRRLKRDLQDLRHEVNRRQVSAVSPVGGDMFLMDPWSSENPLLAPFAAQTPAVDPEQAPYLPVRPKFFNASMTAVSDSMKQARDTATVLRNEVAALGSDSEAMKKLQLMDDLLTDFDNKFGQLQALNKEPYENKPLNDLAAAFEISVHDLDRLAQDSWRVMDRLLKGQKKK